jgi:hypothetical protein
MGAFDHGSFDPAGDARRRRLLVALVILAALFGAALGILNAGGAQ